MFLKNDEQRKISRYLSGRCGSHNRNEQRWHRKHLERDPPARQIIEQSWRWPERSKTSWRCQWRTFIDTTFADPSYPFYSVSPLRLCATSTYYTFLGLPTKPIAHSLLTDQTIVQTNYKPRTFPPGNKRVLSLFSACVCYHRPRTKELCVRSSNKSGKLSATFLRSTFSVSLTATTIIFSG